MGTIPRSSMLIMSARAKTNTAYQAWAVLGQGSLVASSAIFFSGKKSAEILVASVLIRLLGKLSTKPQEETIRIDFIFVILRVALWMRFSFQDHICFGSGVRFTAEFLERQSLWIRFAFRQSRQDFVEERLQLFFEFVGVREDIKVIAL